MDELKLLGNGRASGLIAVVLGVVALYWARALLIPLALAVLISFLLYPLVARLLRLGIHRGVAVALTTILTVGIVGGIGYVVSHQALDLTTKLPDYRDNLKAKIRGFKSSGGSVTKLNGTIQELKQELASSRPATESNPTISKTGNAPQPIPVQVINGDSELAAMASSLAGSLIDPLGSLIVSFVFLIFILLGAEELRDRIIWIAGARQISVTTSVIDDIAHSISRFLRMQLMVNTIYGILVAAALLLIGVPNALLWGLIAGLLRYVPYIGPWIAAAMPTLLSIAVFQGWGRPLMVIAAFAACEAVCNLLLEPWLYSSSTGISEWGVVISSFFWGWLWGPVGLIVAVPMTACLVVVGRHVRQFSFFTKFLGTGAVLSPEGKLYQRLLAWDETGASEIIGDALKESDAVKTTDSLLAPVLETLKLDLQSEGIHTTQAQFAARTIEDSMGSADIEGESSAPVMVCLAAQSAMDDSAARLLVKLAHDAGYPAVAAASAALVSETIARVKELRPRIVAIVQVRPLSLAHSSYLIKSMRKQTNAQHIIAVCIDREPIAEAIQLRFQQNGAERVFSSFNDVIRFLAERASITCATPEPVMIADGQVVDPLAESELNIYAKK